MPINRGSLPSRIDESLKSPHLNTIGMELSEAILDVSLTEGILKDLPGFKILFGLKSAYTSYSDRIFINKLLVFFSSFKEVPRSQRIKQIEQIDSDPYYRLNVGEKLLYLIDKSEDRNKAQLIGYLMRFFLEEKISYQQFLDCSRIVNMLDINELEETVTN